MLRNKVVVYLKIEYFSVSLCSDFVVISCDLTKGRPGAGKIEGPPFKLFAPKS